MPGPFTKLNTHGPGRAHAAATPVRVAPVVVVVVFGPVPMPVPVPVNPVLGPVAAVLWGPVPGMRRVLPPFSAASKLLPVVKGLLTELVSMLLRKGHRRLLTA